MAKLQQASPEVPLTRACDALGLNRATVYRAQQQPVEREAAPRPPSARRLSDEERDAVYTTLVSDEFADQPPLEVFASLLSRAIYLCSIRTMYRILHERGVVVEERRKQRVAHSFAVPRLVATAPNQVWVWDITRLPGHDGKPYYLYSIIDLFSRFVVGWMVADCESAAHARQLFVDTCDKHHIGESAITLHSDRGSPMTSDTLAQFLATLGVARSFSRPRVSNDNPHIESSFKTMKYQPTFPTRFGSLQHARAWLERYFDWYHRDHHHVGLALFTPADVFHNRVEAVAAVRQQALEAAYGRHPERFPKGVPVVRRPASRVVINPLSENPPVDLANISLN